MKTTTFIKRLFNKPVKFIFNYIFLPVILIEFTVIVLTRIDIRKLDNLEKNIQEISEMVKSFR